MTINKETLKSALVSTILMGILAVLGYILQVGDVFKLEWHDLINIGVMALLTGLVSLIKTVLTSSDGVFAGIVQVK